MHTPVIDKSPHRRTVAGAGGRLRQRLAQLLVRSSCTTNTTKTTTTSATAFVSLDKTNASPHQEPPHSPYFCSPCVYERPKLEDGSRARRGRRSASLARFSVDCTGGAAGSHSVHSDALLPSSLLPTNDAKKQSKSRGKPRSPSESRRHRSYSSSRGRARRPKRVSALYSCSSSSFTVTDDEIAPYGADDESGEEAGTRMLFSSLSLSSDSTSEYYHTNSSNVVARKSHKNAPRRAPRRASPRNSDPREAIRQLLSVAVKHHECNDRKEENATKKLGTEAVCSGMAAVVKQSSNPYADFQSSTVEMAVQRRIASVAKMEELLDSYLSLNSPEHHPAILAAFEDVWEAVFGCCERPC